MNKTLIKPVIPGAAGEFVARQGAGEDGSPSEQLVLVVDDEPHNANLAVRWLSRAGYHCLVAESGERALCLAYEKMPDLVLLDVMMAGMDGYAVCEHIRRDSTLCVIPVIFVTAHTDPLERARGLYMGASDYLSKPYHGEELLARVATVMRHKAERDLLLEQTRRLEEQLVRDPMTGLYNRRLLTERLRQELARAKRYGLVVSCLMVDIDHFKQINDTLGHPAGDEIIRQVAFTISHNTRGCDIVARYGGEEFVVILPQTGIREAYEMAERIRIQLSGQPVGGRTWNRALTVSVGVASFPGPGVHDMVSLINSADQALLKAKASGKDRTEIAEPARDPADAEEMAERSEASLRVLIVEDEPNNQALLQKVLTRLGYEWFCVSDGREAVAQVAANPFGLVLMDLSLPGMDGWEATRRIRESGSHVPIIATSAHAMASDKKKAAEAGCTEYLTKPFQLPELRRLVEKYLPMPAKE